MRTLALLLSATLAACRAVPKPAAPAGDIEPSVTLGTQNVMVGAPLRVTYRWKTGTEPPGLSAAHRAFVHFVDPANVILFNDDHELPQPPQTWQPGQEYAYSRIVAVPPLPFLGKAEVRVGLHASGARVPLKGQGPGLLEYKVADLTLVAADDPLRTTLVSGFHPPDTKVGETFVQARWMKREAFVKLRNRGKDVVLFLQGATDRTAFPTPPKLTLSIGGTGVVVPLPGPGSPMLRVRFRGDSLGSDRWTELRLASDQWFVPKERGQSADERELSLNVTLLYLAEADRLDPGLLQDGVLEAAPLPSQ